MFVFFKVFIIPQGWFFPTFVTDTSWGCFPSFPNSCFEEGGKPKWDGMTLGAWRPEEGQINGEGRSVPPWNGNDVSLPEPGCVWSRTQTLYAGRHTVPPRLLGSTSFGVCLLRTHILGRPLASCVTFDKVLNLALSFSVVCFPNWGANIPGRSMSLLEDIKSLNH